MMDPLQLQMMQQAGLLGNQLGLPGMFAPGLQGGIGNLSALSMSGGYGMTIQGGTFPDVSPLAPLGLQNFGLFGTLASMAGNTYLASMFQQNGIIPMGNAGSFSQAQRANQFRNMQNAVSSEIAQVDSDSFYATMKGIAALTGQPFDREQREAARSLSDTLASFGPTIAMFNPEILDAVAGPTGSVQAMAAQMMQANRFRVDPNTGRMGYGEEANTQLIRQLFDELYSRDEMAQMNGIRAGEAGQLYKELSSRGLLSRRGSLRERTIEALKQADNLGQLEQVGAEADVDVTGELDALSFEQLDKLRQTSTVRKLLNSSDVDNIKRQLRGYSDSIAAIREVFGENGNPNAPIPQLIGALEALTSGQMHKFDAAKLNLMVRDMQALSQMSGKSIDQMLAMNQGNTAYLQQVGLGPHAAMFAPTATNVGVAHGMAFADQAGATGFGALNRQQAEQAASRMFARGMASEAGNLYATLGRISNAGGFDETTAAGRRLKAIHDAAYNQQTTYIDPETGEEKRLPTREAEVRGLINQGAAVGMGMEDFNLMLGDRTSNLRMQAEDENYATIAMNQQAGELSRVSQRDAANRLSSALPLRGLDAESRNVAAREMSGAALEALQNLTPQEQQNRELRQRAMADAIQRAALNNGVTLSDSEAETLAANTYGSFENTAVNKFGFESATAAAQVMGDQVVEARTQRTVQAKARAQMNDAMSELGPDGTITQRAFDAIQRQGERGEEANLDTLLTDMFGVEDLEARDKIIPELQAVANEKEAIEKLQEKLNDPTLSQAERAELSSEIQRRTAELKERNIEIRESARELGYDSGEGSFGRDDVRTAEKAAEEMEQLNRLDQARLLGLEGEVTEDEREGIKDERITREDVYAIAESRRKEDLQRISELTAEDIETYSTKVDEIEKLKKRLEEEGVDEGFFDFTGLDPDEIEAIQKEIDQKTAEIIGLSPEIQQEYNRLKEVYGEEVALKRVKELVTSEVGTVDELAEDIAFELGDSINRVGLLAQEDQDAVVRSRRSDEARIPNADAIAKRAAELREGSDLTDEDLEIETLKERARDAETFDMGLRRMREAARKSLEEDVSQATETDRLSDAIESSLAEVGLDREEREEDRQRNRIARARELAEKSGIELEENAISFHERGGVPVSVNGQQVDFAQLEADELRSVIDALSVKEMMSGELTPEEQTFLQSATAALEGKPESGDEPERELTVTPLNEEQQKAIYSELETLIPQETKLYDEDKRKELIQQAITSAEEKGIVLDEQQKEAVIERLDSAIKTAIKPKEDIAKDTADKIATAATNALLELDPDTLADEDDRLEAVTSAIMTSAEEQGFELAQEVAQRQAENIIQQADTVAKQYGSESLADFITNAPDEKAETFREEIRRRQDLAGDQSKEARHQLLAESQLRALGILEEGQTLHASSEEIEKYERLPEELKEALVDAEVSDRADIVDKFIDSQIEQKFYGTEQEREENRVAAIEYLQSDEGERAIEEHKVNFEKMVDLRRELMADPEAIKRLGSARAVEAIDQSRSAEMGLQEMANRYGFNGSVEAMLVSDFLASDAAGMETIEKEFGELSQEDKESIAEGLRETGLEVSAADLTVSDYQVHLRNQMKGYVEEIKESNQTMRGAADNKQRAEELGVTEEQLASIEKLAELEKDIETDAEESAEKIGISEQEYWDMATGAQEFDENLKLFKGEDAAEQLLEAKGAEKTISDAKERLERIEESIAEVEASGGTSEALMIVKAEQEQIIKDAEAKRAEKMKAAGFDPSKQEDVDRYTQLLDHQGDVSLLEERSKNYQQAREDLKAEGKTDEEINAVVDKMIADDKAADEKIAELKKYDISASDVKLAEALGIDTTTTSEELKEFKSLIKEHAGTSDASQRTQEMVADALDEVDKLEGLEGEDAFQKLDNLTDEYNKASPTERKAIAHKYGMAEDELDHLMRKTEFLGLENLDLSDMDDKEKQEVLAEGLERVMGRDIEAEVKQEEERQMKLTGTVNLTGVVQGEGTFDDVTGATVR